MAHVSIIIPVFNRAELIKDTLDSVLWQSNGNWECIVVDDGSTDNTWEVLEKYKERDKRIRIHKRDRGPKSASTCRNIGIEKSQFDYLFFLDSDDILAPWSIEIRLDFAKKFKNEFDMLLFGGMEFNNSDLTNRNQRGNFSIKDPLKYFLNYQVAWGTANILWKKDFLIEIGGWFEPALSSQDSVLHLIALYNNPVFKYGKEIPDVFIRVESGFSKISNYNDIYKILSRIETLYYIESNLDSKDFRLYSHYFIVDLINRIEKLKGNEVRKIVPLLKKFSDKYEIKYLKHYLTIYSFSKGIPVLNGLVYRIRNIVLKHKRIENIREFSYIDESTFNELLVLGQKHKSLKDKIAIFSLNYSND